MRLAAWGILLLLAAFQAYAHRHALSPDGMSYLDLSDAVVNGRWSGLVNLYWSPLYPFVIGVVRAIGGVGARGEVAVIHAVNFLGFAALLGSFEYLLIQCLVVASRAQDTILSTSWGSTCAYALFGAVALTMTPLELTTPDHLSNAAVLLALGALLRLADRARDRPRTRSSADAVVLGAALGLGFLAKSFLAPWAIVCFVALAVVDRPYRFKRLGIAVLVWAIFVLPWTALLSSRAGRLTFGDTGRLTYAWFVNSHDAPSLRLVPPDARNPAANALLPGVGITGDAPGTDPMWLDPARWNASLHPVIDARDQFAAIASTSAALIASLSVLTYVFFLVAVAPAGTRREAWRSAWIVWIPVLAGIGAYTMVLLTARYIMAFIVAGILTVFATIPIARRLQPAHVALGLVLAIVPIAITPYFASSDSLPATRFALSFVASVAAAMLAGAIANMERPLSWVIKTGIALILALLAFATSPRALILLGVLALIAGLVVGARAAIRRTATLPYAVGVQAGLGFAIGLLLAGRVALRFIRDASAMKTAEVSSVEWQIADDFARNGIAPGTPIALVGPHAESYWARTARVKIVANVPDPITPAWWNLPRERRDSLLTLFANAGARVAIVAPSPTNTAPPEGWTQLREGMWVRPLTAPVSR